MAAFHRSRFCRIAVCLALAMAAGRTAVVACDTPVYRYAMYRWEPAPYEVYYFHDQPASEADQKIARVLQDSAADEERPANLIYFDVNLTEDKDLTKIPPDVKKAFLAHQDRQLPTYLVFAPYGVELLFGKLDEPAVPLLLDSPTRREVAKQLAEGKAGTFLFVPCADAAANSTAEQALRSLVEEVNSGKLEFYAPPVAPQPGAESTDPKPPGLELGLVTVKRDDPQEYWLLQSLLSTESDLKDLDKPMVFLAYGRARVLPAYVGPGISRDNLLYEIEFITGACSCTVKEQNPGVDLLVRQDWEEAAMQLAEKFGAEEGNPYGPGMFYPELVIPSGATTAAASAAPATQENRDAVVVPATQQTSDNDSSPKAPDPAAAQPAAATPAGSASSPAAETAVDLAGSNSKETSSVASASPTATGEAVAANSSPAPPAGDVVASAQDAAQPVSVQATTNSPSATAGAAPTGYSYSSLLIVGGGLLVSLVVLGLLTFLVMRPH